MKILYISKAHQDEFSENPEFVEYYLEDNSDGSKSFRCYVPKWTVFTISARNDDGGFRSAMDRIKKDVKEKGLEGIYLLDDITAYQEIVGYGMDITHCIRFAYIKQKPFKESQSVVIQAGVINKLNI